MYGLTQEEQTLINTSLSTTTTIDVGMIFYDYENYYRVTKVNQKSVRVVLFHPVNGHEYYPLTLPLQRNMIDIISLKWGKHHIFHTLPNIFPLHPEKEKSPFPGR